MRDYLVYAIIETAFIKTDPRFRSLPPLARWLFTCLWVDAFHHRREQLPYWYDTAAIQDTSGMDARSVRKHVALLQQKGLILVSSAGAITVCGVKGKGNIQWKEPGAEPRPEIGVEIPVLNAGSRVEKSRVEKSRVTTTTPDLAKQPAKRVRSLKMTPSTEEIVAFEKVWNIYPRKEGRAGSLKLCLALTRTFTATWADLEKAAMRYCEECMGKEAQFVKMGPTFFGKSEAWKEALHRANSPQPSTILPFGPNGGPEVDDEAKRLTDQFMETKRLVETKKEA